MEKQIYLDDLKKDGIIKIKNEDGIFLIIQDFSFNVEILKEKFLNEIKNEKNEQNEMVTIIVDINKLSKNIMTDDKDKLLSIINEILKNQSSEDHSSSTEDKNLRIIYKNSLIESDINIYIKSEILIIDLLYISDELYSISPNLNSIFSSLKAKTLILKKIKFNNKAQLEKFFDLIINSNCEELILEDIFIELILKDNEKDLDYNKLNRYFFYDNGVIRVKDEDNVKNTDIKKIKMIDCPLFAIKENTFKKIKDFKDISIDIDENSLPIPIAFKIFLNKNLIIKSKLFFKKFIY